MLYTVYTYNFCQLYHSKAGNNELAASLIYFLEDRVEMVLILKCLVEFSGEAIRAWKFNSLNSYRPIQMIYTMLGAL